MTITKPKGKVNKARKLTKKEKEKITKNARLKIKKKQIKKKGFSVASNRSKYKQGKFWSKKNQKEFVFRSAYEFGYFHILEADNNVVSYIVEPFQISYRYQGSIRKYWPDLMVLYKDGSIKILEIKPAALVNSRQVQAKAAGARMFLKRNIPTAKYAFITEVDIFDTPADYKKLVKLIK
jgi:hypothetical protein